MNEYYKELGIDSKRVSANMEIVKRVVEEWSEDKRQAARISLQEDIEERKAFEQISAIIALFLSFFAIVLEILKQNRYIEDIIIGLIYLIVVLFAVMWMRGKKDIHLYVGLLSLLEELKSDSEHSSAQIAENNVLSMTNETVQQPWVSSHTVERTGRHRHKRGIFIRIQFR